MSIAHLLIQFNSSVNPIVYATTVPEFKNTIRKLLYKKGTKETNDSRIANTKSIIQNKNTL